MAAGCARSAQAELPGVAAGLPQRPCCQVSAQLRSLNLALIKHCSKVLLNAFFVSSGGLSHLCAHPPDVLFPHHDRPAAVFCTRGVNGTRQPLIAQRHASIILPCI